MGGSAALGCALAIGLASGCAAPSAADGRLGSPVTVAPGGAEPSAPAQSVDTSDQALAIALAANGLTADQVTGVNVTQDTEDGTLVWDVELYYSGQKIDVEVRAADGAIIDRDGRHSTTGPDGTEAMSVDQAKQIVSDRVRNATSVHIELDHDHGRTVYEGTVIAPGQKYEFEIDAITGEVLEWEADHLD
jgi:uncharacterized membrane protein YkoI